MSVYVDQPQAHGKRKNWCHMIADTQSELHAFAARIDLKRAWFQPKSWPHYDLSFATREVAIRMGAKSITNKDAIAILKVNYTRPQWRDGVLSQLASVEASVNTDPIEHDDDEPFGAQP